MHLLVRCALGALVASLPAVEPAAPVLHEGQGRIVLVGDSITGLSRNAADGFAHRMEAALRAVHPGSAPILVALGGSGQSVESWGSVEQQSRTADAALDVKGIVVRSELDQPADALVIMLGMNNVLAPYTSDTPESLDGWVGAYRGLATTLRTRTRARVLALASITPCTEDAASPRNRLIGHMNQRVRALAEELGARYLATGETVEDLLARGRALAHGFHVTYDYVHPNRAGHLGIALAMLRGLGEEDAARWLEERDLAALTRDTIGEHPAFAWTVASAPTAVPGRFEFRIGWWWPGAAADAHPRVRIAVPAGWTATDEVAEGVSGAFTVTGTPDRLRTTLVISGEAGADQRRSDVVIPAPWLVAANLARGAEDIATPVDHAIQEGADPTAASTALAWRPYFPSVAATGGDDPASVDFTTVSAGSAFEGGYALRWIHSDRARPVHVTLRRSTFAGELDLTVWLGGHELHRGGIPGAGDAPIRGDLAAGWNLLAFKAVHQTWQWQAAVALDGVDGDDLADCTYAITPPAR